MTLPPGRELSDDQLQQQFAGFVDFARRGGGLSFADWMDAKDFAPGDRTYLEATYMVMAHADVGQGA